MLLMKVNIMYGPYRDACATQEDGFMYHETEHWRSANYNKERQMQEQLDQLYENVKEENESLQLMVVNDSLYLERTVYPAGGQYTPRPFLEDEFAYHEDEEWSNSDNPQVIEFPMPSLASLEDLPMAIFVLADENYLDVHELGTDCGLEVMGKQTLVGRKRKLLASDIIAQLKEPYRNYRNNNNITVKAKVLVKEWRWEGKLKGVLVMLEPIVPGPCPYCKNRKEEK